jgi:hypothetical protein
MIKQVLPLALAAGLLVLTLPGCGPGRGDLAGKVSYQGKPLRSGSVSVAGSDGIPRASIILADGRYEVPNLPAGPIKAAVTSPDPVKSQPHARKKDEPPPTVDRTGWFAIPDRYGSFDKSGLTFTLKVGPNTWDIDLP